MRYRKLGSSDLEVSTIALGSWLTYGVGVRRSAAESCVREAFDQGINFIDTANVYGRGAAEAFLGDTLADVPRDSYVLATKVYFPMSDTDFGLSREQIYKQIDASLDRLRTDYVDLYQCHRYDSDTPLDETLEALTRIVDQGKARYIGFSEWSADQIRQALELPDYARFVSSQPQYSMLWRLPETEVMPLCKSEDIRQIVWSPLAQGALTGKYSPGKPPPENSRAANETMNQFIGNWVDDDTLQRVEKLRPVADDAGISMAQMALAWVLNNDNVAAAIIGASRREQVRENAAASDIDLDSETMSAIEQALS